MKANFVAGFLTFKMKTDNVFEENETREMADTKDLAASPSSRARQSERRSSIQVTAFLKIVVFPMQIRRNRQAEEQKEMNRHTDGKREMDEKTHIKRWTNRQRD